MSDAREDIIGFFEKGIFPYKDKAFETKEEESEEELEEELKKESKKERTEKFFDYIEDESKCITYELFKKHFNFSVTSALVKQLYETKNKKENYKLVNVIKSELSDLKNEIKEMPEDKIENEKPDKVLQFVKEILDFNKEIQNQPAQGLKILTPNQMLSGLPITLAQLKAGNNSEKHKNEIRQLLKKLTYQKNGYLIIVSKLQMLIILLQEQLKK